MNEPATPRHTNRLSKETSPYLLQHQHNPVDWYPWGPEAFEKAKRENKPILVSIGYSACHWCHVMERESFENEEIARLMNETAVCIKVDREERPDVDAIYMEACVAMSGHGGWPLNAFVTPDLKPIFVGTYFPPDSRYGRASWPVVVQRIGEAWKSEGDQLARQADQLHRQMQRYARENGRETIDPQIMERAIRDSTSNFDPKWGGFGSAPKFPPDTRLALLLAAHHDTGNEAALAMVTRTLDGMAYGGMYDQVGGGFARYSVDEKWLIPHFEKMLYNQALLVPVYLDAFLITGKSLYKRIATETLDWVLRDLTSPEGVFYCAYDADSEGEEGKFYVWTPSQVEEVLGKEDAAFFCDFYGITQTGNFEHGTSNPHVPLPPEEFANAGGIHEDELHARLQRLKLAIRQAREKRVWPGLDDKALTSWNGLMITAFCRGYQVLDDERYLQAARKSADFILTHLRSEGHLLRSFAKGQARIEGMLDDYAFFVAGLLDLYETCFELKYLQQARELTEETIQRFGAPEGGFFFTAENSDPALITRTRETNDGALPAGNSVAIMNLLRLALLFDRDDWRELAHRSIEAEGVRANSHPGAFASLLLANRFSAAQTPQIVITGNDPGTRQKLIEAAWRTYLPARSVVVADPLSEPLLPVLKGKLTERTTGYVCFNYACQQPVHAAEDLRAQLTYRISPE